MWDCYSQILHHEGFESGIAISVCVFFLNLNLSMNPHSGRFQMDSIVIITIDRHITIHVVHIYYLLQNGFENLGPFVIYCLYFAMLVIEFSCQLFTDMDALRNWRSSNKFSYKYQPLTNTDGEIKPLLDSPLDCAEFLNDPVSSFF